MLLIDVEDDERVLVLVLVLVQVIDVVEYDEERMQVMVLEV